MNYRKVHIQNLENIQKECLHLIKAEYTITDNVFSYTNKLQNYLELPGLRAVLIQLNLLSYIQGIAINITHKSIGPIHTDTGNFVYSFNIPISNCDNTYITFYNSFSNSTIKHANSKVTYRGYDEKNVEQTERHETIHPAFVYTQQPHSFESYNEDPRIMLLIRLTPDWTYRYNIYDRRSDKRNN